MRPRRTKRDQSIEQFIEVTGCDDLSPSQSNIKESPSNASSSDGQLPAVNKNLLPPIGSFAALKRKYSTGSSSEPGNEEITDAFAKKSNLKNSTDQSLRAPTPQLNSLNSRYHNSSSKGTADYSSSGGPGSKPSPESQETNAPVDDARSPSFETQLGSNIWQNITLLQQSWLLSNLGPCTGSMSGIANPFMFPTPFAHSEPITAPPQGINISPSLPSPQSLLSNPSLPGPFTFNSGSWCQIIGPTGQPLMAWVPSGPGSQLSLSTQTSAPQSAEQGSRPLQNSKLTTYETQRENLINEQNKERLRIREMRRAETLRKYMEGGSSGGDSTARPKELLKDMPTSGSETSCKGSRNSIKESENTDSPGPATSSNNSPNGTNVCASQPSQILPMMMRMTEGWQNWNQAPINLTGQLFNVQNGRPSDLSQNLPYKQNGFLRNSHKLYGKFQPRSYGYGDIIPQCVEHKETVTQEDRDRAMKMLTESFEAFLKKREQMPQPRGPSKDELAESAALLADYNRSTGLNIRNVAHRRIEEEYANQRREFHDAVDALQMPAYKNSHERWICSLCPADAPTFLYYKHLLRHAAHHLDIKPFKCPFCLRCFRRSDTARRHQLSCVQLSLAVKERNLDRSSRAAAQTKKPEEGNLKQKNGRHGESTLIPDDDETSEEELKDSDDDTQVGYYSKTSGERDSISNSIPPVVMPIQD